MSEKELIKFLKKPLKGKVCKALTQEDNKILLNYITRLQQENKQLKSILTELEEWLKEKQGRYRDYLSTRPENDSEYNSKYATQCGLAQVDVILDKIQELKEKYK